MPLMVEADEDKYPPVPDGARVVYSTHLEDGDLERDLEVLTRRGPVGETFGISRGGSMAGPSRCLWVLREDGCDVSTSYSAAYWQGWLAGARQGRR